MNKKIFIGTGDTSGFYSRLNKGFEDMGVNSWFVEIETNKHQYTSNRKDNKIVYKCKTCFEKARENNGIKKFIYFIAYQFYKLCIFFYAICKYDIFIFTQCKCFWSLYELRLLKILKKTTCMFCLGSATRLPYTDGTDVFGVYKSDVPSVKMLKKITQQRKRKIKIIERYVSYFINLPAQAQLCSKPFLSLGEIGIPFDFDMAKFEPVQEKVESDCVSTCILHAASYLGCRGTKEFREIIEELKNRYNIKYIELHDVPNCEVLKKIQECDFILDEMYSDTPMATFATEAAWFGKPAVVGGYFSDKYTQYYSKSMLPPSLYVRPEKIEDAIIKMIEDKNFRLELGKRAQQFVRDKMSCEKVAERVIEVLEGKHNVNWYVDPHKISYIYGYGMTKELIKEKLQELYNIYGEAGWGLSEHPELRTDIYGLMNKNC